MNIVLSVQVVNRILICFVFEDVWLETKFQNGFMKKQTQKEINNPTGTRWAVWLSDSMIYAWVKHKYSCNFCMYLKF